MNLEEFYERYGSRITQASERLFVDEFLYPLLGAAIARIVPQQPFLDRTGKSRRIDFVFQGGRLPLALEVNGETYHAEGIIPNEMFDANLFRQNEILRLGYRLARFSYSQLQAQEWRPIVMATLRELFAEVAPDALGEYTLTPNPVQNDALNALDFWRARGWKKGVVVLPTGTGKTILSALDALRIGGRVLFLVHRLDILKQSIDAYKLAWPTMRVGCLTGEERSNERDCDVLFASKDTLRQPELMEAFGRDWFDYVVVDEVHHGQTPTYRGILEYFEPKFMLGMTATPDRTDRKDIFELFDYNKAFEISLQEVIDSGYLVPFTYYGLTDDIDYGRIRFQGQRYRVDDLERALIIPERNAAILREYLERGEGDKAIGFCVSIRHAERMAEYFQENGVSAAAIHSENPDREQLIADFREDRFQVAFTVDLFNEGIDFPNVRVLLFLRPTESKTVFIQQLGRGLRKTLGKDRVRILDFIGNYRRANQVRKFLSKNSREVEGVGPDGRRQRKLEYSYSNGCAVSFDPRVEEMLDRQDAEELGIDKQDLIDAYFALAEKLERKPSRSEIDEQGEHRSARYAELFGSWMKFLREIGEYTEASYHYPQGTHLGHVLSILWFFGQGERAGTQFDDAYIRLRGDLGEGRVATYQRQLKYKLLAAMELGILEDDRRAPPGEAFVPKLTASGMELRELLAPRLQQLNLVFPREGDGVPSSNMAESEATFNAVIRDAMNESAEAKALIERIFLGMSAVRQMMRFLYQVARKVEVPRAEIYEQFFSAPFVRQFCDREGIEEATIEASKRRCPFLLNILDACGIIRGERSSVVVLKLALLAELVKSTEREEPLVAETRLARLVEAWPANAAHMEDADLSILRELFGREFLTPRYHLQQFITIGGN